MSLLALYLALAISFGPAAPPALSLAVDPWLLLSTPQRFPLPWGTTWDGLTLPGLVWASSTPRRGGGTSLSHEIGHVRQIQFLGAPAFSAAYLLTAGRAFEDYWGGEWAPPPTPFPRCPLLTFHSQGVSLWQCAPRGGN